ncbi:chaperonin [Enterobacter sp. CM29]|uniref:chaperonin n=1 Tax=Enterobacter sp. CM29 TaxID=2738449 RepID=UPI0015C55325|nr:chaperonin [Enterobacter sp. CM29]NQD63734.1 chaperonin [Enterobacter sp. CM29]
MARNKQNIYDVATTDLGSDAKLKSNVQSETNNVPTQQKRGTRTKTLKAIPEFYFDAHENLRTTNKTNLPFSNYIMEAIREKLERDGAL